MKPRERIFAAFDLEEPDRVPVFDWGFLDNPSNFRNVEKVIGRFISEKAKQAGFSARANPGILDALIECCVKVGLDMTAPHLTGLPPKEHRREGLPENVFLDEWGVKWRMDIDFTGKERMWYAGPAVENVEDLDSYKFPDPHEPGRMDAFRYLVKKAKDRVAIAGTITCGVPDLVLGFEKLVMALYKNPRPLERYLDRLVNYNVEIGKALVDEGAEIIIGGYELGLLCNRNGPMISPQLLRKYQFPRWQHEISNLKRYGLTFYMAHVDGNFTQLMDDFMRIGLDAVHPIERPSMDIKYIKENWGGKVCVMGNVDCGETLVHGSISDVQREVRECIDAAASGGGYILSSSDSLHGGVKTENFVAMVHSAHKYGIYPKK